LIGQAGFAVNLRALPWPAEAACRARARLAKLVSGVLNRVARPAEETLLSLPRTGSIVVLTGAGISAESGLATFRGAGGLWEGHRPEDVATPEAFARDPALVHRFYNQRRRQLHDPAVKPNAAHDALARLEAAWPDEVLIVTQNVDDLHERGGSRQVLHMHGELRRVRCTACGNERLWLGDLGQHTPCPACRALASLRPAIVWFGEMPLKMERIMAALQTCRLFVAIGTSGHVYPAAGFVEIVRDTGRAHTIEVNLEPSAMRSAFAECRIGPAAQLVPTLVEELLQQVR
jgi:NAD-dependent deacetylase